MLNIGPHISIAKGYEAAGKEALKINANTFQFFTRNPRGGKSKELDPDDVRKLEEIIKNNDFAPILAHAPYTLNMASAKDEVRQGAKEIFRNDLDIMNKIPSNLYNFHPGSYTTDSLEIGIERIASILNECIREDDDTYILLETMSGKGSEIGRSFEELREIIDRVHLKDKMGVCLDTCHVYCAGYDIVNDLDGVITKFDKIIGLNRLKAIHLNDTQNDFKTFKDRHAKIGEGFIKLNPIINLINHPALNKLPFYLETPNDAEGYKYEIELLRKNYTTN
ncbi:deoxyribonuclease IV [Anaerofustis sp.]|uniref:deoxyribonuclease IV n=1 Tax=Anaerofustis sp. TaxID=1872517 RepID=UPI0025C1B4E9|nr:deoxyribonuclease IV [Anaerofustis sp.]